jgi:hypothetical protein
MLVGEDGKTSPRTASVSDEGSNVIWPAPVEETVCLNPYLLTLFPPNRIPKLVAGPNQEALSTQSQSGHSIQIRSFLHPISYTQTFYHPFSVKDSEGMAASPSQGSSLPTSTSTSSSISLRLLTISPSTVYAVSSSLDKTQLAKEGTSIWALPMKNWLTQVDELIGGGMYQEAVVLMATLDVGALPEKVSPWLFLASRMLKLALYF